MHKDLKLTHKNVRTGDKLTRDYLYENEKIYQET